MRRNILLVLAVAAIVAGAAVYMIQTHPAPTSGQAMRADAFAPGYSVTDEAATRAIVDAGVRVDKLMVRKSGDIVVLRGSGDAAMAQRAADVLKRLGASRVANLIVPVAPSDDEALRREAERQLAAMPGLDGTRLIVKCENGVVTVSGTVQRELQKDLARNTLRSLRGAREVRIELASI